MIKINAKYILAAMPHISSRDSRYYLEGIHFEAGPKGVICVATDGHSMFAALDTEGTCEGESQIIPISKELAAACKPARNDFGDRFIVFENGRWEAFTPIEGDNGPESSMTYALGLYEPIDATYPDWRRVIPTGERGTGASFNPDLLVKMQKSAKALGALMIKIIEHSGQKPALIEFGDYKSALGVLMPMRNDSTADVTRFTWENQGVHAKAAE